MSKKKMFNVFCTLEYEWCIPTEATTAEEAREKVENLVSTKGLKLEEAQRGDVEVQYADLF